MRAYAAFDGSRLDINEEDINLSEKVRFALNNRNTYGNITYKGTLGQDWMIHTGISYGQGSNKISINQDKLSNMENAVHAKLKLTRTISDRISIYGGLDYFYTNFDEKYTEPTGVIIPLGFPIIWVQLI